MEQLKVKFPTYTPDYVIDEVEYYYEKISKRKPDAFTLDNAIALVNLAVISTRITKDQGEVIKKLIKNIKDNNK